MADAALKLNIAPVVTVVQKIGSGIWGRTLTPGGRLVMQCPAETSKHRIQCSTCGNGIPLCARIDRKFVIGFTAHGVRWKTANEIIRRSEEKYSGECK